MKTENAIEVHNVVKKFRVYLDRGYTLKELALFKKRRRYEERIVLNDINFEIKKGQAVGLIGKNGCGKSTTLKLLTRIMYPDSGTVEMRGRVSSLIELGAGFHPDMSGRQNIYTNASIFGLTKKEIEERVNDIIEFSELQEYIDNPVRTYSSGMYMRLAFAVAINVDADILLIDEILAVGDANFQVKCFEKLREIKQKGTTVVIVSHSMGQIEQICDRCLWIHEGEIKMDGVPKTVDEEYLYAMDQTRMEGIEKEREKQRQRNEQQKKEKQEMSQGVNIIDNVKKTKDGMESFISSEDRKEKLDTDKWKTLRDKVPSFAENTAIRMGTGEVEFTDVRILNIQLESKNIFKTGDSIIIEMDYKSSALGKEGNFGIGIFRDDGIYCYGTNIEIEKNQKIVTTEKGTVRVRIEKVLLLPGKYYLDIAVHGEEGYYFDDIRRVMSFHIMVNKRDGGVCRIETEWDWE